MPVDRASRIVVDKEFKANSVEDVFYKYKAILIEVLTQNLIKHDKDQPGKLLQSVNVDILIARQKVTFELSMEDYWKFVNEGVDGTETKHGSKYKFKDDGDPINLGAVKDFIKVRGLSLNKKAINKGVRNKTIKKALKQISRDKALSQAAFAIGRSIKKKGIKPTHFYSDVVNEKFKKDLKQDLTMALKRDVEVVFKELKEELK